MKMFSAILTLHTCGKRNIQAQRSCPCWGWRHRSGLDPTRNPAQSLHPHLNAEPWGIWFGQGKVMVPTTMMAVTCSKLGSVMKNWVSTQLWRAAWNHPQKCCCLLWLPAHKPLPVEEAIWPQNRVLSELFSCRHPLLRKIMPLYMLAPLWEKLLLPEGWWPSGTPSMLYFGGCRVLWGCRNN